MTKNKIGRTLLEEIIKFAEQAGYEQIELEVSGDNSRAINLYKKFGFKIYGTRDYSLKLKDGTYSPAHLMIKRLI